MIEKADHFRYDAARKNDGEGCFAKAIGPVPNAFLQKKKEKKTGHQKICEIFPQEYCDRIKKDKAPCKCVDGIKESRIP
jgi:hypothetical protein